MTRRPSLTRRLFVAVALATLAVVVQVPAAGFGFVNYDDNVYVTDNRPVRAGLTAATVRWAFTTGHAANYHPLTWLSLAADVSRGNADPAAAMHQTNLALHAANAALAFLLLAVATGADGPAAAVAAVFAVHPVHVESVAWVAERKDVLCGLFYLAAALAHVAVRSTVWRVTVTTTLGVAALLSKPMAVSLPAALLLLDAWPLRRTDWRRAVLEQVPLAVLCGVACGVTVAVQSAGGAVQSLATVPAAVRLENVPVAYVRYLGMLLWPARLAVIYPYATAQSPAVVGACVGVLAVVTILAWRARHRQPFVLVGWLWFVITLLPVIGLVTVGDQPWADRYLYLPMLGPTVAVVWSARPAVRRFGTVATVAVVAALSVVTWRQVGHWRDSRSLFEHAVAVTGDNPVALTQLAYVESAERHPTAAMADYAAAVRLGERTGLAAYNLGNLLQPTDPAAAAAAYRQAARLRPRDWRVQNNLAAALARSDPAAARVAARSAVADAPDQPDPHLTLGQLLLDARDRSAAAAEFAAALRLDPSSAQARRGLAACHR